MSKPGKRAAPTGRRPTAQDVAHAAGVSLATVSYVLNNAAGHRMSPATRAAVFKAAEALGYQPNVYARALSRGHSDEIANLITEPLTTAAMAAILTSEQERAHELGYTIGTYRFPYDAPPHARQLFLDQVLSHKPAALICNPLAVSSSYYRRAREQGVRAFVMLGVQPVRYAPMIVLPFEQASQVAGQHLVERGHRRVAFATVPGLSPTRQATLTLSLNSLRSVLTAAGGVVAEFSTNNDLPSARAAVDALLQTPQPPTAIYCFRDEYCFPILRALLERGVRVPQQVALMGTDNSPLCALAFPSITSVEVDHRIIGLKLIGLVDCLVKGQKPDPELLVPPPPTLFLREST